MAPRYVRADLFTSHAPVLGVTTNSCIDAGKKLIMGRGAAESLVRQYPKVAYAAGRYIANTCGNMGRYGWFTVGNVDHYGRFGRRFGFFQTKYNWREPSKPELIAYSVEMLNEYIAQHNVDVAINFPGIGNGHLPISLVFGITEQLSDRVTLYYSESKYDHWFSQKIGGVAA